MKVPDRELVILLPHTRGNDRVLEKQAIWLHELLDRVETIENCIPAVEFLNIHRGGISNNPLRIEMALRRKELGSFQFIIHKN
jgi:hypothetical protein